MRPIHRIALTPCLALALLAVPAFADMHAGTEKDIVETAAAAGSFDTLLTAAEAAGLVGALKGDGPLTVFAPTDEAFSRLPAGTVESLLEPENRDQLVSILKYHVVPAKLTAGDVTASDGASSLLGEELPFRTAAGGVQVGAANVVQADIACSNGVIHVIDAVLLPAEMR